MLGTFLPDLQPSGGYSKGTLEASHTDYVFFSLGLWIPSPPYSIHWQDGGGVPY